MSPPLIRLENVSKVYNNTTLATNKLNLIINHGEMIAIVGSSGCGKSTLLHILGLLDRPTAGKYYLDDVDVSTYSDPELAYQRNYNIGFLFQSFFLIPRLTVERNIILPLLYRNIPTKLANQKATQWLNTFGIRELQYKFPNQLSGGQKQRVALCRALIGEPSIILADEPTGALDKKNSQLIIEEFQKMHRQQKTTMIIITHDLNIAKHCQRMITLDDGRLIADERQMSEENNI